MATDAVLLCMYALLISCNRKGAIVSLCAFAPMMLTAWLIAPVAVPWMFFVVMWAYCAWWFFALARHGQAMPCIGVAALSILEITASVDRLIYESQATDLYNSYETMAILVHLLIMVCIVGQGYVDRMPDNSGGNTCDSTRHKVANR